MIEVGEQDYMVITTLGEVTKAGKGGVIIVAEDNQPILVVSEVSDDETINLFLRPIDGLLVPSNETPNQWEVLRSRSMCFHCTELVTDPILHEGHTFCSDGCRDEYKQDARDKHEVFLDRFAQDGEDEC